MLWPPSTRAFIDCVARRLGEAFHVASRVMMEILDLQALADPFAFEDSPSELTALGYLFPSTISASPPSHDVPNLAQD
jgi:hypothetical protein